MPRHQDAQGQADQVRDHGGDKADHKTVFDHGQPAVPVAVSGILVRELLFLRLGAGIVVIGKAVEIDGGFHIFVRAQLGRILGFDLLLIPSGLVDHVGDLLAAESGIGGAQVDMNEILVDEGEAAVHEQQVLMRGPAAHQGVEAAVGIFLQADIPLRQHQILGILDVVGGFNGDETRDVIPQARKHALFTDGQQIAVAAGFHLAALGAHGLQVPDLHALLLVLLDKFLYGSVLQVRVFILDRFLIRLIIRLFGVFTAVQRFVLVFQEGRVIRIIQIAVPGVLVILVHDAVVIVLFIPRIVHLENHVAVDQRKDQQHDCGHHHQQ